MKIFIPASVTHICQNAFTICLNLQCVEFASDSQLQIIEKEGFAYIPITQISIPSHLKKICEGAFKSYYPLEHVEIPPDSQLQVIEKYAFFDSSIRKIFIPSKVFKLEERWCANATKLNNVEVEQNNQYFKKHNEIIIGKSNVASSEYDNLVFANRNIKEIKIQPSIKRILSDSFARSSIEKISFPPQTLQICEYAFEYCKNLRKVDIPINSELQLKAFSYHKMFM